MSGTDLAYGATRFEPCSVCRDPNAISGTTPLAAYAPPTRCPVLTWRMVLCASGLHAPYAMPGTDIT
eukprot:3941650-Rhodomonas_salina.2